MNWCVTVVAHKVLVWWRGRRKNFWTDPECIVRVRPTDFYDTWKRCSRSCCWIFFFSRSSAPQTWLKIYVCRITSFGKRTNVLWHVAVVRLIHPGLCYRLLVQLVAVRVDFFFFWMKIFVPVVFFFFIAQQRQCTLDEISKMWKM